MQHQNPKGPNRPYASFYMATEAKCIRLPFALNGLSQHALTPRPLKSFLVWQACKSLRDLFPTFWSVGTISRPPVFRPPLAPPPGQCDVMDVMDQCDVPQDAHWSTSILDYCDKEKRIHTALG